MRVLVIGGTRFVGRRVVEALHARGDAVLVVHRGQSEPQDWVDVRHLHTDRRSLADHRGELDAFAPEAVLDTSAMTSADVEAVLPSLPEVPVVVLSSQDVYRAYEGLLQDERLAPLPLTEESELRHGRYPYRGMFPGEEDYEKLDVEDAYRSRRATVLRLPMVYGPHDDQFRAEFVLRRVLAERTAIPTGPGDLRWTRGHVDDIARAVLAAVDTPAAIGRVVNLGETPTDPIDGWMRQILTAAGSDADLVQVPEKHLPDDVSLTRSRPQSLEVDPGLADSLLGWRASSPADRVADSVAWHLSHATGTTWTSADSEADEQALRHALGRGGAQ